MFTALTGMHSHAVVEASIAAKTVPVLYLPSPALEKTRPLDFSHTQQFSHQACELVKDYLANVTIDGPGLYTGPNFYHYD